MDILVYSINNSPVITRLNYRTAQIYKFHKLPQICFLQKIIVAVYCWLPLLYGISYYFAKENFLDEYKIYSPQNFCTVQYEIIF